MRAELVLTLWLSAAAPAAQQEEGYGYQDGERVRGSLATVLERPEFDRLRARPEEADDDESWIERVLAWLDEWLDGEQESRERTVPSSLARTSIQVAAGLTVLMATLFLLRATISRATDRRLPRAPTERDRVEAELAPAEQTPRHYLELAERLHRAGRSRDAIGALMLAIMSGLERSGRIRHRPGLTSRDYLRAGRGEEQGEIRAVTDTFERVFFGRREATEQAYRNSHDAAVRLVRGLVAPLEEGPER